MRATKSVLGGDLTTSVDDAGRDELGQVCLEFNKFVVGLHRLIGTSQQTARNTSRLAGQMSQAAGAGATALAEVAVTIEHVAAGATQQAGATQRVSETTIEMVSGIDQIGAGCRDAGDAAAAARDSTASVRGTAADAVAAMRRIHDSVGDASEIVGDLGARSQAIGEIVASISEIASQTNLLALNAAIEAARAGEHGRGFSVVADEVRRLAESTRAQTASITTLVGEIQSQVAAAVDAMRRGGAEVATGMEQARTTERAFDEIAEAVTSMADRVTALAAGAEQLDAGSGAIRQEVEVLAAVGQQHAASADEVAAATLATRESTGGIHDDAIALEEAAQDLERLVGRFRVTQPEESGDPR